jgi:membrane-associated protein
VISFDLPILIRTIGYFGVAAIVFAESGLFIGFFLPGDSLLFTAGFLASQDYFNVFFLIPLLILAAILGDTVGYLFGAKVGPKIFSRPDSLLFHQEHIQRAEKFYKEHGRATIILARFMPVIRTFAPIIAGVGRMPYRTFIIYNIVGGFLWVVMLTLFGYFLGRVVPNVDRYILPIVFAIILLSVLPGLVQIARSPESRLRLKLAIKGFLAARK